MESLFAVETITKIMLNATNVTNICAVRPSTSIPIITEYRLHTTKISKNSLTSDSGKITVETKTSKRTNVLIDQNKNATRNITAVVFPKAVEASSQRLSSP